jgi:hypothetical protein
MWDHSPTSPKRARPTGPKDFRVGARESAGGPGDVASSGGPLGRFLKSMERKAPGVNKP